MLIKWGAIVFLVFISHIEASENDKNDLLIVTAAPEESDALRRFLRSASEFNHDVKVLKQEVVECEDSMDQSESSCEIGDQTKSTIVSLLRKELEKYKYSNEKLILFTLGDDAIINNGTEEIVKKFQDFDARVVFSAYNSSDLSDSLKSQFVDLDKGKPYLSHLGFIGYAPDLYDIINNDEVKSQDDDLLFFTQVYLSKNLREKHKIKIDHTLQIFQILDNADEVQLVVTENSFMLNNTVFNTNPEIIIAKDSTRPLLNMLGDYLGGAYQLEEGCIHCQENKIDLENIKDENLPSILVGIFIADSTPFFTEFLTYFSNLDYPKKKMDLYVHLGSDYNQEELENYLENHGDKYSSVKYAGLQESDMEMSEAKTEAINLCIEKKCDYYLNLDATSHLEEPQTLKELIQHNRTVIAPLLVHDTFSFQDSTSNIWRKIASDGTMAPAFDYQHIIYHSTLGLWNVAFISASYLINATLLYSKENRPNFFHEDLDPDAALSYHLRSKNIFMYASNINNFGHLVDTDYFVNIGIHSDFLNLKQNSYPWMKRYLADGVVELMENDELSMLKETVQEPCRDVYLFPFVKPRFIEEIMDIIENKDWPSEVHTNIMDSQVETSHFGLHEMWASALYPILQVSYAVLYEKTFLYERRPNSFIIRKKGEDPEVLKPTEDNSTMTVHLALNSHGDDYEGGGFQFLRYNCIAKNTQPGWILAYPGQMTHNYEELKTTKGTKYSLVSYIIPIIYDQIQK